MIRGTSNDVIHSFWVPNLHGKRDLIPSRITDEWIQADQPGRYRGQCAEFCGHAARAHGAVGRRRAARRSSKRGSSAQLAARASSPPTPTTRVGQQVFVKYACVYCHNITRHHRRGTGRALT